MSWVANDDDLNLSTANCDANVEEKVKNYTQLFDYSLHRLMLGGISIFFCDSDMTFNGIRERFLILYVVSAAGQLLHFKNMDSHEGKDGIVFLCPEFPCTRRQVSLNRGTLGRKALLCKP